MALAPNTLHNVIVILPVRVSSFHALRDRTPIGPALFLGSRLRNRQVPFQQGPQFIGYFRRLAEP
jgi:hypothetical protein